MTDKDWEKIEEEWETPEEKEEYEYKPPKQKGLDMEKLKKAKGKKLENMIAESQVTSGPQMMFATLNYSDCCTKNRSEEIANKWASMLRAGGMELNVYVIEDNQVLFSTNAGFHAGEIRDYAVQQPECVAVEWNQKRMPGPAETPEWKAWDAEIKAKKKAEQDAKKEADEAVKKAEEKKKKKKKKKKAGESTAKAEL